jgi:hypothetical protein
VESNRRTFTRLVILGSPRGQGARQAPPHGFGWVGAPTASGLAGRRSRSRNRRRSLRTDTAVAASAANAMASGPTQVLPRKWGTITMRRRQRKTTGRGTWRRSPGNGTPPGAGVGRVCWAVGGLPLAELHGRWLVGGDDDCGRLAGSTGFGPSRSHATACTSGRTLASTSGCSGSQLRPTGYDTASVEQTFNGRSPREHRTTGRLQCRSVATDSLTDQGLEVEETGPARCAVAPLAVRWCDGSPGTNGEKARTAVARIPWPTHTPDEPVDSACRDHGRDRSADRRGG